MSSSEEERSPHELAVDRVAQLIAKSELDRVPTSRQKLSQQLVVELKLPMPDITKIVNEYCDENAPAVPFYLQAEFEFPYLKLMAVVNSILGVACVWYGATVWHRQQRSWPLFLLGAVFVALAGYSWFKTIQQELAKG